MIQPATLPAAAKLLLAPGDAAATGDGAAFDAQFSALLAANFITPDSEAAGKADAATAADMPFKAELRPANDKPTGKLGGKMSGKILPDSPALAAFAAMLKDLRGARAALREEAKGETSSEAIPALTDQTLPTISNPAAEPAEQKPVQVAAPAIDPAFIAATLVNDIAPALPLSVAKPAQAATLTSAPLQPAAAPDQKRRPTAPDQPHNNQSVADGASAVPERAAAAPVQPVGLNPAALKNIFLPELAAAAPASPASADPAAPGSPAPELPQPLGEATRLVIQSGLTTRVMMVPRSQPHLTELGKLQTMAIEQAKIGDAGTQIDKIQTRQMPEALTAPTAATNPPANVEKADAQAGVAAPEPARTRSHVSADAETLQKTPGAALAQLDAAPLFAADLAAAPDASPAGAAGPAPAVAPSRTPDFAALIDRLVEARAAAQATLEPHTVNAAIQHAEFGEVSLQFRQDAAGLSVAMASADPDLAKALQVAAPSSGSFAGQFASNGDGNAPQWRQDTSGQASASASQPQSQTSQNRGQSPQRAPEQTFGTGNPSPRTRSQSDQTARSGIFA